MTGRSWAVAAVAAAGTAAIAGLVVVIGGGASGATDSKSPVGGTDPAAVRVHRSTQDPDQVRRYWTPERLKQADDNMRHRTGAQF